MPSVAKNAIFCANDSYLGLKTYFLIIFITLFSTISGVAQRKKTSSELGLFLGGSYYIGDLNPNGHFSQFTKPAGGLIYRYNFYSRYSVRLNALYGNIEAHDSYSDSPSQVQRNLNFKSDIIELSAQFEFNFQNFEIGSDKKMVSPYIFLGLGGFFFNPKGKYLDGWVGLRDLRTEGQGLKGGAKKNRYSKIQISVPFGLGVKAVFSKGIGIAFEWGMRKTFTDYLDDVSKTYFNHLAPDPTIAEGDDARNDEIRRLYVLGDPSIGTDPSYTNVGRQRGNATTKDWYSFFGIILSLKLNQKLDLCPGAY